jgi:hypothetical protein
MNGTRLTDKTAQKDISDTSQNIGETIMKILILYLQLKYPAAISNVAMIHCPRAINRNVYFSQVMRE